MQMTPVPMVGDTDIACQDFRCRRFFDGYGQLLYAVGRSDSAAVAEALFPVVLAGFELYGIEGMQFAIVADRRQIGGGKADDTHHLLDTFKQLLPVVAVPAKPYVTLDPGFRNQPEVSRIDCLIFIIRKHPVVVFPEKQVTCMPAVYIEFSVADRRPVAVFCEDSFTTDEQGGRINSVKAIFGRDHKPVAT